MDNVYVPSTWRRLVAHGVDQLIRVFCYIPFAKPFFLMVFTDEDVKISLLQLFVLFMVPAIYELVFLILFQATPGKWLLGLKVVPFTNPSEKLDLQQCILRPLMGRLSFFFSWAIYALAFFRYDRTHIMDWVAETRVVQFSPRATRAKLRPILGVLLILLYVYEGLSSARGILQVVDWENGQVELRSLLDFESLDEVMEEYDY